MTGRSHFMIGACVVTLATATGFLPWSWPEAAIMATGLILAGSDAPDLDHKTSTISKAWGPVTWILCRLTRFFSNLIYRKTRTDDEPRIRDPHRTFTHTWLGAVVAGGLVTAGLVSNPIVSMLTAALLFGAAIRCFDRKLQSLGAILGGVMGYGLWPTMGGTWWIWWLAFTLGCFTHVWSDCVTKEGAPLSWPFTYSIEIRRVNEGDEPVARLRAPKSTKIKRWHMVGPPEWLRFYSGGKVEVWVVRLVIAMTLFTVYLIVA